MLYHIWYTYWYTYWKLWLHLVYNLFEHSGLLWGEGVCMSSSWILNLSFRGVLKRKPCPCWYFTIVFATVLVGDASCRLSSLQPSLVTVSRPGCRLSNFTQSGPQNRHTDDVTGKLCCLFWAIWRTVLCIFVHFSWLLQTEQVKASKRLSRSCW